MITQLFTTLGKAMGGNFEIALMASLAWGVLSILLSPCHLASIPLIIGYISRQGQVSIKKSFNLSSVFAIGILATIVLIGIITSSMGRLLGDIGFIGNLLVAAIFVVIGLYLLDVINFHWNGIPVFQTKRKGVFGALILGLVFGIGLGPCTFAFLAPVLGAVFHISQSSLIKANLLLLAFGVGHVAVIVSAGTLTNWVQRYLNWTEDSKAVVIIKRVCGALVLLGGIYLLFITV